MFSRSPLASERTHSLAKDERLNDLGIHLDIEKYPVLST